MQFRMQMVVVVMVVMVVVTVVTVVVVVTVTERLARLRHFARLKTRTQDISNCIFSKNMLGRLLNFAIGAAFFGF